MKDSFGNELPKLVVLWMPCTDAQRDYALAMNSFLLDAEMAMQNGFTVEYNAEAKIAKIRRGQGHERIIFHP